nr:alpha/beta hydrolase domain-containing protein [Cellulosimicrobium sp. MM]
MSAPPVRRPLALALAGVLVLAGTALPASAAVPDPVVTGPVPTTTAPGDPAHGYPFLATDYDLAARGYVEEEFFVEGEATRYQADGVTDATVLSTGHAFRTRVVVRRPVDPATFNGTVIAEWYNVSNQWDQEVDWFQTHEHLVREGYAWVGVSAQRAGVHSPTGLRAWSPERYGTLDLTDGGTVTDDTLSWDVFSQAVAAVRDPAGTAPLGPLEAERVVATGHSQSAGRLWSYVNSVDPLAGVVDAVVLHGGGGLLRDDLETPVFKINSETDVAIDLLGAAQRQPDTDVRRTWEVAGASHGDWKLITDYGRLRIRDVGSAPGGYPGTPQTCEEPSGSRVPQHLVQASVYDHVAAWVADGTTPPSAAPITLSDQAPRQVVRDERGLGLGGVRLAQQDVPTRINSGANAGPGFCFLDGGSRPVDDATLAAWYPDAEDYRDAVVASTRAAVEAGFVGADVAADPSWYTDVVDLVDERVAAGTVEPEDRGAGPGPDAARARGRGPA